LPMPMTCQCQWLANANDLPMTMTCQGQWLANDNDAILGPGVELPIVVLNSVCQERRGVSGWGERWYVLDFGSKLFCRSQHVEFQNDETQIVDIKTMYPNLTYLSPSLPRGAARKGSKKAAF
jgi:hypothetical protein